MASTHETVIDRGEETRRHILGSAARVFSEKGYAGASFSDLIAATGLTKGALYFHFDSKEALALAAFGHVQEQWVSAILEATDPHRRAVDQLTAMLAAAVDFAESHPAAACTHRLSLEMSDDPELRPRLTPYLVRWEEMVAMLIRQGQREGDLRADVSADEAARVAVGAFIGIHHASRVVSAGEDLRTRAEEFLRFFLSALAGEGRRRGSRRRAEP